MTTASSEIQRRESLRVDAGRLMIAAGIIVAAVAVGVVLNQGTITQTPSKATVSEQTIDTTFLADTNPVRLNVMEKMNGFAPEVSSFVGSNNTPTEVMNHMNEISPGNELSSRGVSITLKVMRHMNEFSAPAP